MVNPNMEWYLLAGMSDVPKIDVHLKNQPERGVIGIGEPPTVSDGVGHRQRGEKCHRRDDSQPAAHASEGARRDRAAESRRDAVKAFAYVNPTNEKEAVAALQVGAAWRMPLAGGQDLLARMKDYVTSADRIVNVKNALDATVTPTPDGGLKIGAAMKIVDLMENAQVQRLYPAVIAAAGDDRHAADSQSGHRRRQHQPAAALLVLPQRRIRLLQEGRQPLLLAGRRKPVPRDFRQQRTEPHRASVEPGGAVRRVWREVPPCRTDRRARSAGLRITSRCRRCGMCRRKTSLADDELLTHVILPPPGNVKTGHYEVRYKASHDWPLAFSTVVLAMNGNTIQSARVVLGAVAPVPWRSEDAERALVGKPLNEQTATRSRRGRGSRRAAAEPQRLQSADRKDCGQARHFAGGGTAGGAALKEKVKLRIRIELRRRLL